MSDATAFKAAMRHVPTAVTVVTSLRSGEPRGITLSAFVGVSADPPLVAICVNRDARSYLYIAESQIFCVNVLSHNQRELAERFSGKVRERQFDALQIEAAVTGAPVLRGALAYFDCRVEGEHRVGSHSLFVGRVLACASHAGSPLGYFDGTFRDFGLDTE